MRTSALEVVRETMVVFRKEIRELFRDYRTILGSLGVPLVLFPVLAMILSFGGQSGGLGTPTEVLVTVSGPGSREISEFFRSRDELRLVELTGASPLRHAIANGRMDVAVDLGGTPLIAVIFDNTSHRSSTAAELIIDLLNAYLGGSAAVEGNGIALAPLHSPAAGAGTLIMSFLLPVIVLVAAAIGPLASAADLGAGEKERRTLQSLFGSPARRSSILSGKFLAVVVMALVGVIAFFAGSGLAWFATRSVTEGVELILTARMGFLIAYVAFLSALTFSGIELLISIYARSLKAAQTFCVPVLILASAAGYATVLVDLRSPALWYYHVPLLNLGLLVKGAVLNVLQPVQMALVSFWVGVYVLGAFALGRWLVNREAVYRTV